MHNTYFDDVLTINLPSFTSEVEYLLGIEDGEFEHSAVILTSKAMYDYVFHGVDFSKVKTINFFHLTLFEYFRTVDFSSLETVNFDVNLFTQLIFMIL